jgi:threonine synthase
VNLSGLGETMQRTDDSGAATAMRNGWSIKCPACGHEAAIDAGIDGCPACREQGRTSAMLVHYDPLAPYPAGNARSVGIWANWGDWLPAAPAEHRLTLGEGNTPLLQIDALCALTGCPNLYLKMEAQNPSGAHKDRFHAVTTAVAAALGKRGVVAYSTGNHGLAMSAYATAHGLESIVIANERMPLLLQRAIRFANGLPLLTNAATGDEIVQSLVSTGEWLPALTLWPMPVSDPIGVEGYKTIAYEIYRDLGQRMGDRIFVPTAGGDLLTGIWLGQRDLARAGLARTSGRLVAVQPAGASPLVNAFVQGLDEIQPVPDAYSIALSIADPISGRMALDAVRATDGDAVAVSDEEILETGRLLASYGLFVEPSSAAPVAAVRKRAAERPEMRTETIVCVLTSSALKWLDDYGTASERSGVPAPTVEAGMAAVEAYLSERE